MVIISLSDIHGDEARVRRMIPRLKDVDLVVLAGDITNFGGRDEAARIIEPLRATGVAMIAVHGNCDLMDVASYLEETGISLHRRHRVIDGICFAGVGGSLPCPVRTPIEYTEDEFGRYLSEAVTGVPEDMPLVLVCHQPPYDTTNDRIASGLHVGSHSLRDFIDTHRPLACFTAHIHEAAGTDDIGPTRIVNPGPLWHDRYACARLGKGVEDLAIREL
jgi:uncharacterized protein